MPPGKGPKLGGNSLNDGLFGSSPPDFSSCTGEVGRLGASGEGRGGKAPLSGGGKEGRGPPSGGGKEGRGPPSGGGKEGSAPWGGGKDGNAPLLGGNPGNSGKFGGKDGAALFSLPASTSGGGGKGNSAPGAIGGVFEPSCGNPVEKTCLHNKVYLILT